MSIVLSSHQMSCDACKLRKIHQESFPSIAIKTNKPLQLIHSDVWGPSPNISIEGYRFYLLFVDDFSHFCWIYPMKHKSKVPYIFLKFQVFVEKQLSSKILALQTDWGREFRLLLPIVENSGTLFRHSCPYTHQQQGRVE